MTVMSLAALVVLVPMQLWFAHGFYAAYAEPSRRIEALDADYAVIAASGAPFAMDLVLNAPWLGNRPIRLIAEEIGPELTQTLCAAGPSVAIVPNAYLQPINDYFRTKPSGDDIAQEHAAQSFAAAGCHIVQAN